MKKNNLESQLEKMIAAEYKAPHLRTGKYGIIYTRVSSIEQQQNNGSLEVQMKINKEFATRNGITIKEFFGGKYESAKTDGRKEFQRMLTYVRKHKDITYIIVSSYDRFSRTGSAAAKLSEDLRKDGIIVKSVMQDIDTSTASGRLQENFMHMMNNFDNVAKSDRTKLHTREVMEKGYWPYAPPLGYKNIKRGQRACFHEYVINEAGKELKKVFHLTAAGKLSYREIVDKFRARGVNISEKSFRGIISNPFYAGYVTGKLLEGRLVKGKHPALIDLKTFLKAGERLNQSNVVGIPKVFSHEEVPLKIFAKDEISRQPLTGYITKKNWYYKTKSTPIPINVKAEKLNEIFAEELVKFEYNKEKKATLKKVLLHSITKRLSKSVDETKLLKKKLSEKEAQLEKIEKKFLLDGIDKVIYQKHATIIKQEIEILTNDLNKTNIGSSNLEKAVEKCLDLAQNISGAWVTAGFESKRGLQSLVFPNGILFDKEKGTVRTERTNSLFSAIPSLVKVLSEKKKGNLDEDYLDSNLVTETGFEPARRFQRHHLKVVRLPISPPGHVFGLQI
jgi:site-specific DNA recombinase